MDRVETARRYFEAYDRDDRDAILALLTEDVVWDIHGAPRVEGKDAFAAEIANEGFEPGPDLDVDRFIDAGDAVVVPHRGETRRADGTPFRFEGCDILTFEGELISRIEAWIVPLSD